jgi:diguanylate cyclase (GGDEF)-like protein
MNQVVPSKLGVLFIYRPETDEIVVRHASGLGKEQVQGLRLRLGAGVSGWVAAHRRSATNSDARLDLNTLGVTGIERLTTALSTPLIVSDTLVGVLTLYAESNEAFSALRTIDLLNPHISRAVKEAIEFENEHDGRLRDKLTGLPHFKDLSRLVAIPRPSPASATHPLVVVFVDVDRLKTINRKHGLHAGDEVLKHVTQTTRNILRVGDLFLRYGSDEFVVLLGDTDLATAQAIALRVVTSVSNSCVVLSNGEKISVRLLIGVASAPSDGDSLDELVAVARNRAGQRENCSPSATVH